MLGLNPYVLLAIGMLWAASCGSAYVYGHRNATNAAKAAHSEALDAAVKQHNENAVIDMQAAVEAETKRQQVRVEYRDRVNTVERLVREEPNDCRVSDAALGVLNQAVDAANKGERK